MEEVVGLCLEVCGALLPIVKPPVLIKVCPPKGQHLPDKHIGQQIPLCLCAVETHVFDVFASRPDKKGVWCWCKGGGTIQMGGYEGRFAP